MNSSVIPSDLSAGNEARYVLASGSPRRVELLRTVVPVFEVVSSGIDESAFACADPQESATAIAQAKATSVARRMPDAIVIAGDTIVARREGRRWLQFGKPGDAETAIEMLERLSGRRHLVVTAVAISFGSCKESRCDTATVHFRNLGEREIMDYVGTGEPLDKAGAYAIQGAAAGFVERLEGDVETVIGLPTKIVKELLARISQLIVGSRQS